jgi:PEGA domain/PDZ domain
LAGRDQIFASQPHLRGRAGRQDGTALHPYPQCDHSTAAVHRSLGPGQLLVIAKGGTAWATVTEAESKKRMARGGKLNMNIDSVRLMDGEKAALRAVKEVKGGGHTGAMTGGMVATAIVFWPAAPFFLFMHGKDISIPKGTEITAYVNGDFGIDLARFQEPGQNSQALLAMREPLLGTASSASNTATLDISSMPPDADIELDGGFAGNTPSSIGVAGGEHALRITKKGFAPWERKIRSSSGTIRVSAELEPLSATPASAGPAIASHQMNVSTTPAEPNRQEPTPQLHPAILSNAEGPTMQATAEGNSSIETNGTVSITSSPDGAEIFIDSIGRGHAPALPQLKPGKHTVQLVLSGYEDLVDEIDVRGGSIVNVTGKMGNVEGGKSRFSNVSTLNDVAVSPRIASIGVFSDGNPTVRHDGVTLTSVSEGGPADQAGIKVGDVILAINNHYLFTVSELKEEISHYPPGTKVAVHYRSTINDRTLVVGQSQ